MAKSYKVISATAAGANEFMVTVVIKTSSGKEHTFHGLLCAESAMNACSQLNELVEYYEAQEAVALPEATVLDDLVDVETEVP